MWRRSWLSREVLLFAAFSGVAARVCRRCSGCELPGQRRASAALTVAARPRRRDGQRLHLSRARRGRPGTRRYTLLQFNLTAASSGRSSRRPSAPATRAGSRSAAAAMAGAQLVLVALRFLRLIASRQPRAAGHGAAAVDRRSPAALRRCAALLLALGAHRAAAARRRPRRSGWSLRVALARRARRRDRSAAICSSSASSRSTWPRRISRRASEAA